MTMGVAGTINGKDGDSAILAPVSGVETILL